MRIRTYSELSRLPTFEERFDYLKLNGLVGEETFGFNRYLNQALYGSRRWIETRHRVIIRDNGCDLAIGSRQIYNPKLVRIHHMNPITVEQILDGDEEVFNDEYLICTSLDTHNAIHYGNKDLLRELPIERQPNDMIPWK